MCSTAGPRDVRPGQHPASESMSGLTCSTRKTPTRSTHPPRGSLQMTNPSDIGIRSAACAFASIYNGISVTPTVVGFRP